MDAFALEESQNLSIFFATNNSITTMLKKALEEVSSKDWPRAWLYNLGVWRHISNLLFSGNGIHISHVLSLYLGESYVGLL